MAHYISLARYTQKGIENLKDAPKRVQTIRKACEAVGGKLKAVYWTFGQYDAVVISQFPDDETGLKVGLAGAMQGYVRGETLRAFTEEEFSRIIASIS